MAGLLDDFAAARAEQVTRRGGDTFVAIEAVPDLIDQAKRRGIKVLGLEGFMVGTDAVYPALSRIADFSADPEPTASDRAQHLARTWASAPTTADQMHSGASGRHMVIVVLDE